MSVEKLMAFAIYCTTITFYLYLYNLLDIRQRDIMSHDHPFSPFPSSSFFIVCQTCDYGIHRYRRHVLHTVYAYIRS